MSLLSAPAVQAWRAPTSCCSRGSASWSSRPPITSVNNENKTKKTDARMELQFLGKTGFSPCNVCLFWFGGCSTQEAACALCASLRCSPAGPEATTAGCACIAPPAARFAAISKFHGTRARWFIKNIFLLLLLLRSGVHRDGQLWL